MVRNLRKYMGTKSVVTELGANANAVERSHWALDQGLSFTQVKCGTWRAMCREVQIQTPSWLDIFTSGLHLSNPLGELLQPVLTLHTQSFCKDRG